MNLKNLAMWVIIVVLTIGLYNMFKNPQNLQNKNSKSIIFSEFLTEVDNGRVVQVEIQGNNINGILSNGEKFTSFPTRLHHSEYIQKRITQNDIETFLFPWFLYILQFS